MMITDEIKCASMTPISTTLPTTCRHYTGCLGMCVYILDQLHLALLDLGTSYQERKSKLRAEVSKPDDCKVLVQVYTI